MIRILFSLCGFRDIVGSFWDDREDVVGLWVVDDAHGDAECVFEVAFGEGILWWANVEDVALFHECDAIGKGVYHL